MIVEGIGLPPSAPQGPGPAVPCAARAGLTSAICSPAGRVVNVRGAQCGSTCTDVRAALLGDGQCAAHGPQPRGDGVAPISRRVGYLAPVGEARLPEDCLR